MPQKSKVHNGTIKVGATGTISSLMSRELESTKHISHSPLPQSKLQAALVSVHCGAIHRKSVERSNLLHEPGSSSSNAGICHKNADLAQKLKYSSRRAGSQKPMLATGEIAMETKANGNRVEKKGLPYTVETKLKCNRIQQKGHANIVEVVDLKCNNPMSSQFKKLGFSKLSKSSI